MAIGRIMITDKKMKDLQETNYLQENGWHVRTYTMSGRQTYLQGILFALPFLLLAGGTALFCWNGRCCLITQKSFFWRQQR